MHVFVNGAIIPEEEAHIHLKDRGLLLGDGLFETCKTEQGKVQFFDAHYARLKKSADFLSIPLPYRASQLLEICQNLLSRNNLTNGTGALRITLTRGLGLRGINIPATANPTLFITTAPYHPVSDHYPRAFITGIKRNPFSPIVTHKTLHYLESILARSEAQSKGFDEGIMLNTEGLITECSVANLFLVKDETLFTPRIENGLLPGIMRSHVLTLCQQHDIPCIEKDLSENDALNADEAFQTNCLIGIQPLSAINEKEFKPQSTQTVKTIISVYQNSLQ